MESEPGTGTTFIVVLPVAMKDAACTLELLSKSPKTPLHNLNVNKNRRVIGIKDIGTIRSAITTAISVMLLTFALAQGSESSDGGNAPADAASVAEMFKKGTAFGNIRALYFSSHNHYFLGLDQDTASSGDKLDYTTAKSDGFSAGVRAFIQRGIAHHGGRNENP